jgi:uncharacterized membrane protein
MLNPFDLKSTVLAKHAQQVVLIHLPVALYISGTCFDLAGRFFRKGSAASVALWNFLGAAIMSLPAAVTGLLAWRYALDGQALKGLLRLHLMLAWAVLAGLWSTVWLRRPLSRSVDARVPLPIVFFEVAVSALFAVTAHIGRFLSGVNM